MDATKLFEIVKLIVTLGLGFALLVFFHELGHFSFAKLFKMRVEEFALGMGNPKFRLFHDGETEYTVRAFPLGGFVRIAGMEIEDAAEQKIANFGKKPNSDHDDKTYSSEDGNHGLDTLDDVVAGSPDPNGFNSRPIYQRYLVILAGPVFSLILGWLALCLIGVTVGYPAGTPLNRIAEITNGGVADKAGLKAGESITAIDGKSTATGEAMIKTIHDSVDKPLQLTVTDAKGIPRIVSVVPQAGQLGKTVGLIGIVPEFASEPITKVGVGESFTRGTQMTGLVFKGIVGIFRQGKVRENLGGPIAIVTKTSGAKSGAEKLLLLGQLSLSLAFFNMLPIPILDGGHLTLFTLEAIRRRKLTAEQTQRVFMTGFALIILLVAFVWLNDISRLPIFHRG